MSECATISEWQLSLLALANFLLLADSPSVKLTSKEAIKETKIITKDCGNLTPTQHLPETSFDPSPTAQIAAQTVELLPNDNALLNKQLQRQITNKSCGLRYVKLDRGTLLLSQIGCIICLANTIIKANIIHWCEQVTRGILAAELYAMAHGFGIKKRHWGKYQIV